MQTKITRDGRKILVVTTPIIHGRYTSYVGRKCRCAKCTKAWSTYSNNYRRKYQQTENGKKHLNKAGRKAHRKMRGLIITDEDCIQMLKLQKGKCGVCKNPIKYPDGHKTHVDHCHTTGKIRELLCLQCNTLLGKLEINPLRTKRLLEYMTKWRILNNE